MEKHKSASGTNRFFKEGWGRNLNELNFYATRRILPDRFTKE